MPSYRLYRLDRAGKIVSADWLQANADDEALRQACEQMDGYAVRVVGSQSPDQKLARRL